MGLDARLVYGIHPRDVFAFGHQRKDRRCGTEEGVEDVGVFARDEPGGPAQEKEPLRAVRSL